MISGPPLPVARPQMPPSSPLLPSSSLSPDGQRHGQAPSPQLCLDYQRLRDLCPVLNLRVLDPAEPGPSAADGWYSGAQLASDERALAAALACEETRIAAEHGRAPRPHVTASRLLHHYLWSACLLIAGPWHLARRVPRIDPADLWLHAPTGDLALRPRGHVSLPGESPVCGNEPLLAEPLPGESLPGEDELRAELRAAVVAHVEPLLAAFAGPTRRRDRALWGMVTDDMASALWYLGRMLGEEDAAVAAAEAVLPGGTLPLPGAADFRRLHTPDGRSHPIRTRLGCCLYYAVKPEAVACITCPRTSDEERLRRL
ncbi:(2Fe-2S)-binding protein [Kitasatospora aureofaciens]|uniref:(2Fe-2S)-binding protein n=1 Tax=Kitasatospora aureofaciens TaxID=1894 RepID=UPI00210EEF3B|nr:(2Fe-2S)-binding protein [Kitasatospora aureofaciens]